MKTLKELRQEHHLSQQQLADELGIARITIARYETGTKIPDNRKAFIACYFDIDEDSFTNK